MNIVPKCLYQEISIFGYRFHLGQALVLTAALSVVTACALKRLWRSTPRKLRSAEENFWLKVKEVPTFVQKEGPIMLGHRQIFSSFEEGRLQMSLHSTKVSEHVATVIQSRSIGTVLDLGCGVGANSIPFYQKGWDVVGIDIEPKVIQIYSRKVIQGKNALTLISGDITDCRYPENVEVVVALDVLSYIPPTHLKTTINKIFLALRPGGKFIGSLFFRNDSEKNDTIELMGKMGGHLYPGIEFLRNIVTRSGFQIEREKLRNPNCFDFLATKPSNSVER